MDIVAALKFYRLSVVDDPAMFFILHLLYKDGIVEQEKLKEFVELQGHSFKVKIREMYQASLVRAQGRSALTLTHFGREILARFGADNNVAPFLIDEIVPPRSAQKLKTLVTWAFNLEPEDASARTTSLRNLKVFVAYDNGMSDATRRSIVYWCLSPPEASRAHAAFTNAIRNPDVALFYLSGHGTSEKISNPLLALDGFEDASHLYRRCSLLFFDACKPDVKPEKQPQEDALAGATFRIWNYLEGEASDVEIELTAGADASGFNQDIWGLLWKKIFPLASRTSLTSAWKSRLGDDLSKVKDEHGLYDVVKKAVQMKKQMRQSTSGYHFARYSSPSFKGVGQDSHEDIAPWWEEAQE